MSKQMSEGRSDIPAIEGGLPTRGAALPFFKADIDDADIAGVVETLRSGWLTVGPKTERLERELASYVGARHAIAVSSCSEAMFLCLKALGVGPGDEVITSALTFASTVHAIIHTGAKPVLADIEEQTFGMDPAHVRSLITDQTRAIMPVHFGGQACAIEELRDIARAHGIAVVEDAAHAFGASASGRKIGSWGNATTFSFYATKNLTTAEGGAITTEDDALAEKLRRLSYHGMSRDSWTRYADRGSWYYEVEVPGFKCNMNDVQAALGLTQMAKIDDLLASRVKAATGLLARLRDCPHLTLPSVAAANEHTWHLFVVRLNTSQLRVSRDQFIKALTEENIGSSVHFIPIYRHPFFAPYGASPDTFPRTEDYFARCISLPLYPGMLSEDVEDVAVALEKLTGYYAVE